MLDYFIKFNNKYVELEDKFEDFTKICGNIYQPNINEFEIFLKMADQTKIDAKKVKKKDECSHAPSELYKS